MELHGKRIGTALPVAMARGQTVRQMVLVEAVVATILPVQDSGHGKDSEGLHTAAAVSLAAAREGITAVLADLDLAAAAPTEVANGGNLQAGNGVTAARRSVKEEVMAASNELTKGKAHSADHRLAAAMAVRAVETGREDRMAKDQLAVANDLVIGVQAEDFANQIAGAETEIQTAAAQLAEEAIAIVEEVQRADHFAGKKVEAANSTETVDLLSQTLTLR